MIILNDLEFGCLIYAPLTNKVLLWFKVFIVFVVSKESNE